MRKARIRRRRPSSSPLPRTLSPRTAATPDDDAWRRYFAPSASRRSLKVAGLMALAAHFVLFFVVMPTGRVETLPPTERAAATVLQRWEPPAPPSRPAPTRVRTKRIVPIPWPVPETPYLVVDDSAPFAPGEPAVDFALTSPTEAPGRGDARDEALHMTAAGLSAPRLLEKVIPEYTPSATRAGIQGRVYIEAVITEEGRVVDPVLQRGLADDELNRRALEAVQRWRFEPGTRNGRPVKVVAVFTIDYTIH